jgi:predicted peptidase
LFFLFLCSGPVSAQQVATGFLDRTVVVAGHDYHYQVYVPADYSTRDKWPVILFLHGSGESGSDGVLQTTAGLGTAIRRNARRFPAIVVFPQAPDGSEWVGTQSDMALAALTQATSEFHGDPDRIYLTGLSMGGYGTWYLAYRHPELFAAVVPICGWIEDLPGDQSRDPVVPASDGAPLEAVAGRLGRMPIWIFHGEADSAVPVNGSRGPAAALQSVSGNVRYTEYLGMGHEVWNAVYGSDAFVSWLFAQRRH